MQVQLQLVDSAEQMAAFAASTITKQQAAANAYLAYLGSSTNAAATLTNSTALQPAIAAALAAQTSSTTPSTNSTAASTNSTASAPAGASAALAATLAIVNAGLRDSKAATGPDLVLDWAQVSVVSQTTFKAAAAQLGAGTMTPADYACVP